MYGGLQSSYSLISSLTTFAQQGVPQTFVNIIRSLYSHASGCVISSDDIALIFEDQGGAQALLNKLTTVTPPFGTLLSRLKYKAMLQNARSLDVPGISMQITGGFGGLHIPRARISEARFICANLRHLLRQKAYHWVLRPACTRPQ
ncbi:hypothetical protein T265_05572 [Opisthorchis viverrini]|uniref:Reverse transcriptase domain-containing protein n=1 Tax=Opisthorchis viverrini TaxID=6198 RepID=A0A074ZVJ4_OPIVI|nr:hypothetical protein T265_05572 [Opisthorchis viverrini]KER27400.1 hypothetical protein T265_05572 [Opisthorchis viverrini]